MIEITYQSVMISMGLGIIPIIIIKFFHDKITIADIIFGGVFGAMILTIPTYAYQPLIDVGHEWAFWTILTLLGLSYISVLISMALRRRV